MLYVAREAAWHRRSWGDLASFGQNCYHKQHERETGAIVQRAVRHSLFVRGTGGVAVGLRGSAAAVAPAVSRCVGRARVVSGSRHGKCPGASAGVCAVTPLLPPLHTLRGCPPRAFVATSFSLRHLPRQPSTPSVLSIPSAVRSLCLKSGTRMGRNLH